MYLPSESTCTNIAIPFSYIENTIPPLNINLASLGTAPLRNLNTPSYLTSLVVQCRLFLYSVLASILCIRVLIVSTGCVKYTVTTPAPPPIANVAALPSFPPSFL